MLQLILMRHAKSDWSAEGLSDHERTLNKRGCRDAPSIGKWLVDSNLVPDVVLCSTAKRAQETIELVSEAFDSDVPIYSTSQLYLASPESIVQVVASDSDTANRVLVVGHNPGMESLAGHFTGHPISFPTAAIVALEFDLSRWSELSLGSKAVTLASTKPKEIDG